MSSIAGTAAMVHLLADALQGQFGEIWRRVASALVAGPLVLLLVYLGRPWFDFLVILAIAVAGFEWARLCVRGGKIGAAGGLAMTACLAGALLAAFGYYAAGIVASAGAAAIIAGRWLAHPSPTWLALGT